MADDKAKTTAPAAPAAPQALPDEEVAAIHQQVMDDLDAAYQARRNPGEIDPGRLYFHGVGGVPDGYYDELSEADLAGIKQRMPDVYEGIQKAATDFDAAKKGGKKPAAATPAEAKPATEAATAPTS